MTETRQQGLDEKTATTGITSRHREAWPPAPIEPAPPAYVKEPLFSKKVLAGWAIGTLIVWFTITVVAPEIVRAAKSEIRVRRVEPGMNTPAMRIIETPAGRITLRRAQDGTVTFEGMTGRGRPAAPVVAPAPVEPAPPAPGAPAPSPTN